ncbi:UPF0149 family protein [Endozoicomonas sp. SCSIO W0465]|uniref:UPF0149 family protein n=1 Tax=Endozoicomonas sp. SCSIO W0465 TaxID=2918516 RepID=UPI002074F316|nr:UPF0149 family protein [Endozoicomonas sp. SCSIO W0465]USE37232.1 UPF0149 family protein [Endozoicomonas sp. SCSIO W0465]
MTTVSSQPGDAPVPVSFDELADLLAEQSHPSEVHGYLCGLLSAGAHPDVKQWLEQLAEQIGDQSFDEHTKQLLSQLFWHTQDELSSGSLSVTLFLPGDDESLALRTQSMGLWCQSFISGFGQGLESRKVSEMVEEVLRDFAEISLIETAEENDESEKLYVEVSEFVRLAWLNVYAEVCGLPEDSSGDDHSGQYSGNQDAAKTLH